VRQLTHPSSNHIHATLETRVGTNYLFFLQVLSSVSYALSSVYVNRRVRFLRYMSSLFAFYASISWGAEFFQVRRAVSPARGRLGRPLTHRRSWAFRSSPSRGCRSGTSCSTCSASTPSTTRAAC
jgi:hypothetical protein